LPDTKVDFNVVNPFIEGALETLQVQCSITAKAGEPFTRKNAKDLEVDIAAVIPFDSMAFKGSAAICFPEKVFLSIMGKMLKEECTQITSDLEDGAAELLNITFGHAKRVLNEKDYQVKKAIPTIVRGPSLAKRHQTRDAVLVIPFETDVGPFYIEIAT